MDLLIYLLIPVYNYSWLSILMVNMLFLCNKENWNKFGYSPQNMLMAWKEVKNFAIL